MKKLREQPHSRITKITHWLITLAFAALFGTGAALYNHRPAFHIGSLRLALPQIPSWLTITYSPILVHYIFAALFVVCGIIYFIWGIRGGHFKGLLFNRGDAAQLVPMQLYYLGLRKEPPPYEKYNPLQKLAYSVVLFAISPLIVLSGVAMLPFSFLHPLGIIFVGGVKLWHFALMSLLCIFVIGHVVMVLTTGFATNMRKMVSLPTPPSGAPAWAKARPARAAVRTVPARQSSANTL